MNRKRTIYLGSLVRTVHSGIGNRSTLSLADHWILEWTIMRYGQREFNDRSTYSSESRPRTGT